MFSKITASVAESIAVMWLLQGKSKCLHAEAAKYVAQHSLGIQQNTNTVKWVRGGDDDDCHPARAHHTKYIFIIQMHSKYGSVG